MAHSSGDVIGSTPGGTDHSAMNSLVVLPSSIALRPSSLICSIARESSVPAVDQQESNGDFMTRCEGRAPFRSTSLLMFQTSSAMMYVGEKPWNALGVAACTSHLVPSGMMTSFRP